MKLDIYQVDAFTSELFHGNPAAVVPLQSWLSDAAMLEIAAENNLAETAFFVPNDDGFHIRWFTPALEIDLCGHATVASAYVLYKELGYSGPQIRFTSKSGELRVSRDGGRFVLDFPSRPPVECEPPAGLAEALGATPALVLKSRDYLAVFESESDILALKPDMRAISDLDVHAVIVTAPGGSSDFVSRFFAPAVGVDEDPVTGSAHCTLTAYWAERLGKNTLFARQVSRRGGEIYCELAGDRVKLGGDAVLYLKGEIYVDAGEKSVAA
jgi:PhzF family phenazine biosynthesis protein